MMPKSIKLSEERYGYVYLTTFTRPTDHKEFYYVGQHARPVLDRKYVGSGLLLGRKIAKYGRRGNIYVQVLHWTSSQVELNILEFLCIQVAKLCYGRDCLNLNEGGEAGTGRHDESTKRKMSRARAGVPKPYISEKLKGRPLSEEHRLKIKAAHNTQETWLKKSKALRGIPHPWVSKRFRGVPHTVVKCPVCKAKGGLAAMVRWHGLHGERCSSLGS